MNRRLNVALLGCGGIGARHVQAVAALPEEMQLVGCCGRDPDKTAAFAARYNAPGFVEFERMLDEVQPDLLIVALPPFAHSGQVEMAARAGIHLLVKSRSRSPWNRPMRRWPPPGMWWQPALHVPPRCGEPGMGCRKPQRRHRTTRAFLGAVPLQCPACALVAGTR